MTRIALLPRLVLLALLGTTTLLAADLGEARRLTQQGEAALIAANSDRAMCVDAALLFGKARGLYREAKQWDKVRELNAYIYWCRKRMNTDDLDRYLAKRGRGRFDAAEAEELMAEAQELVEREVERDEAEEFLDLAKRFERANPDKPFLVHVRYLEVAERFEAVDTTTAIEAMRASSDALERFARSIDSEEQRRAVPPDVFQTADRPDPGSLPVPESLELTKAIRFIRDEYEDRFDAHTPSQKRTLMHWLLDQAEASTDRAELCYAMVDQAADLAVDRDVQDPMFVIRCADFVDATFADIDPIALKREWLGRSRGHRASEAIATLLEDPNDRHALAVAGSFLCLQADDWERGLELLVETDDEDLRRAADMERAKPSGAVQQKELADTWLELAEADRTNREAMRRRALHWYRKALPGLSGVTKDEAEEEIQELLEKLPVLWEEVDWNKLDEQTWHRLDGVVVVCRAKHKVTNTGLRIRPGQRVRIVPHPTDRWSFDVGGDKIACTGYGTAKNGKGTGSIRASFHIKNGSKVFGIKDITGPGRIYLRPVYGEVRCKVVDYPPPK